MTLHCKSCKAELTAPLERDQGEYFVSCFGCGVKNIVLPRLHVVGVPARGAASEAAKALAGESDAVSCRTRRA